ncbi:MAG TPA: hypothetical protein VFG00_02615 [Acidothermaceae bacterium]|nr:hypothetical protein [Acidothermaceae bacterium]
MVARGGEDCGSLGQRHEISLQDDDLHTERHRAHGVCQIASQRHDVDIF